MITILVFMLLSIAFAKECRTVEGYASWYGGKFHGRKTASGEKFNKYKYTAASKTFPINSYLLVRNLHNGKEVVVLVTDKGPFKKGRVIDLSMSAAEKLGMVRQGVAKVRVIPLYCTANMEEVSEEKHEEIIRDLFNTL
ncbi:MAG: septal ring lytic transglycosylase RlpA family protein [Acidobacteria bacterium]|nr:MAG: septal ring lytic transglycosylase RlpA family protein [Acidobacteriota bacterium]